MSWNRKQINKACAKLILSAMGIGLFIAGWGVLALRCG